MKTVRTLILRSASLSRSTPRRAKVGRKLVYALTLYVIFGHAAFAQTWQTVDSFQPVFGTNIGYAYAQCLAKDPFGKLYVGGGAQNDSLGDQAATVRVSGDGGATWSISDS